MPDDTPSDNEVPSDDDEGTPEETPAASFADDDGSGGGYPPGIEPIEIQEEMERSFLDYAMSVIVRRALPDARDGLKPVHRRILYGMFDMGARSDRPRLKCAEVTGKVMGEYHPHGDGAIYDALVRMAQPFSLRHPLVDFHGNYGSMDDGAAASRYTECRLHPLANVLLDGIDEDTVDFTPTYTNKKDEPSVLPARFPNLLVNGSQGIAVGMATSIPPHNLGEVIDATIHLIDNVEATSDDLMRFVKGPDFPTGGQILGRQGILDAYRTGRGSVKMRAKAEIVEQSSRRGGGFEIVVTELPYQVGPRAVLAKIAELVNDKTIDGISHLNDESAKGLVRLIIGLKRDANPQVVLNNLYKLTPLQTSFGVNVVALVGASGEQPGVPRTLTLVQCLQAYVDHQVDVITRRTEHRLAKAKRDEHLREGRLKAINVIDQVIALIRASDDRAAARAGLMTAPFEFSEEQAEDILEMTLGRLTRLARIDLEAELEKLREPITELERILGDPQVLRGVIKDELLDVRNRFATPRLSELTHDVGEIADLDLIDDEPLVITMTKAGWVKSLEAGAFRTQGRGGRGVTGAKLKEEDLVVEVLHTTAHAYLLCFSNLGKVYRLRAHEIPIRDRAAKGTSIVNLLPLAPGERIQTIIDTRDLRRRRPAVLRHPARAGEEDAPVGVRQVPPRRLHRHQPGRRRRAGPGHQDLRRRRHPHGQPQGHGHPLHRDRGAVDGPRLPGRPRHEAPGRGRGRVVRRLPRGPGDPARHRRRLRQAHPAHALQRAGPRRHRRHRHQAHGQEGQGRRRPHGRPRRRGRAHVGRRRGHPDPGPRHLEPRP